MTRHAAAPCLTPSASLNAYLKRNCHSYLGKQRLPHSQLLSTEHSGTNFAFMLRCLPPALATVPELRNWPGRLEELIELIKCEAGGERGAAALRRWARTHRGRQLAVTLRPGPSHAIPAPPPATAAYLNFEALVLRERHTQESIDEMEAHLKRWAGGPAGWVALLQWWAGTVRA